MISFSIAVIILIAGYFTYGKFVSKVFGQNPALPTPAKQHADGVDFVELPTWKVFLIQFLNRSRLYFRDALAAQQWLFITRNSWQSARQRH